MAEEPNVSSSSAELSAMDLSSCTESTDTHVAKSSIEEKRSLFRTLQGEITDEHLEAWNQMTSETRGLVLHSPQKAHPGVNPETLLCTTDGILTNLPDASSSITTLPSVPSGSVPPEWSILEADTDLSQGDDQEVREDQIDSVLDISDTTKRMTALSRLQKESDIDGEEFSSLALNSPEVLATYLTGKITFGDFFKAVDVARKTKLKERVVRKRKRRADTDSDYAYEEDEGAEEEEEEEELEDEDKGDDAWVPEAKGTADSSVKKKPRKPRRRKWELPKSLHGLMGETNSQMARGNYQGACDLCLELIRCAPNASQPYDTLAMLYDEQGMTTKATEVLLMSAYLKRTDTDLWLTVTNRYLEQNEKQKAMRCLTQAIKFASNKIELMQEKCMLYEQMGEMPKALMGYTQMLTFIDSSPENDKKYLTLARKLCETYHNMKRTNDAARVLTNMFKTRPSLINSDDMNKLLDLRMTMKQYQACLEGLVDYCGVQFTLNDGCEWNQDSPLPSDFDLKTMPGAITSVKVPDNLPQGFPLDLLTKLCSCLINLDFSQQAKYLVEVLLKEDVEEDGNGERFLDVADAYMETDQYDDALPILARCVKSHNNSQAGVWLRYGECLSAKGQMSEAVEAFSKVVELAPNHLGARVSLSALQQQIGRHDEALQVLSGTSDGDTSEGIEEDKTLLLHKCHLLFSQKRKTEFVSASRRLLFSYFRENQKLGYSKIVFGYRSLKHRNSALQHYMKEHTGSRGRSRGADRSTEAKKDKSSESKSEESKISPDVLWDLYLKMCNILLEEDHLEELAEVTLLGLTCPAFINDPIKNKEAEFLCLTACMMSKNGQFAYNFIKDICLKHPDNTMAWNLFNQSLTYSTEIRHHKFCLRRLLRWPDHLALGILNGHNSVQNGSYRCALGEYMAVFRRIPTDPMISLCIGLCYFHICCQRFTSRKDWLALEGIAFLNMYLKLRGECQEAYYNLGRAMQQLDLGYAAVYYYKKALALPPIIDDQQGTFDLRREIAFNLSLIYKKSGNMAMARLCRQTYVVI